MKFLSDILAKAGLTVDGVVTLNNTATGQTPATNDNSTKLATTEFIKNQSYITANQTITVSGDATGSGTTSIALTLANSGVTAGTYGNASNIPTIVVDAKGRITSISTNAVSIITTLAGLSDVTLTSPSANQVLQYNGTRWVNGAAPTTYILPIATSSILGGIKIGSGLSIDAATGIVTVSGGGGGNLNYRTIQEFTSTSGQTTYTISGGYAVGYVEVLVNGVYISENQYTATNGTTIVLSDANSAGDIVTVFLYSLYNLGVSVYARNVDTLTATAGQTSFTTSYIPGQIDVYYNGSKLTAAEYTATTGSAIILAQAAVSGDIIEVVTYLAGAGVNSNRTLTINGTTYDLTANRTWTLTTANISEVTNLYYTDARARAAISVTGSGSYNSSTGVITVTGGVTSVNTLTGAVTLTTTNIAEGTNLYYTDARVGTYLTTNSYATQSYVGTQLANLVASAPSTLDTLNELAAALGNDPSFATTVATSIGTKVPQTRTITINGTAYDLSADRSWTIASGVTSFNTRTGAITAASGDYTTAQVTESGNLYYTNARARLAVSLTTTGTSGAATYDSATGIFNIPQYQGGVTSFNTRTGAITLSSSDVTTALTYTPVTNARTITINGTSYDLSANRSWTIAPDVSVRNTYAFTATAAQTTFTVSGGYTVGLVDVFINGVKLAAADFTATNGTTVVLATGTGVGNIVEIVKYVSAFTTAVETTRTLTINGTTYDLSANRTWSIDNASLGAQAQLNGTGLVRMSGTTVSYDNATYATQSYVTTAVANLVNAAPSTLDTLNELAAALGNDANFATTITTSIGTKLPSSSVSGTTNYLPKFTGTSTIGNSIVQDNGSKITIGGNLQVEYPSNGNIAYFRRSGGSYNFALAITGSEVTNTIGFDADWGTATKPDMTFSMGTAEKMRLTSSGNLGLGVTPSALLHLSGANTAYRGQLTIQSTDYAQITFYKGATTNTDLNASIFSNISTSEFVIRNNANAAMIFDTNATERMRIWGSTGNVNIGTTPASDSGYKLDVNGTGRFTGNLLAQKVQVGTAATINDATGVGNTLQFANYSAGVFVTGSADGYIYKTSSAFGGLSAQTLIFQTRSDVAGGGFAFVAGTTPSAIATISNTGAATFSSSVGVNISSAYLLNPLTVSGNQMFMGTSADGVTNSVIGRIMSQVRNYGAGIASSSFASIEFVTDGTTYYKGGMRFLVNNIDGTSTAPTTALTIASTGVSTFTGDKLILGSAVAATNIEFNLNGVSNKAKRIQFQSSGTNQWLLGQGAASETSAFELYNASGTIVLSVDKTSNLSTFGNSVQILKDTNTNGTNIEEVNMGFTVLSSSGQSKIAIGACNAGNYGYIQVMQDATSWSTRDLTLQPRGGKVGIGIYNPLTLFHTYSATDNLTTFQAGSSSYGVQLRFRHGSALTGFINSNTTNIFSIYNTNSTEVLSVTPGGDVFHYGATSNQGLWTHVQVGSTTGDSAFTFDVGVGDEGGGGNIFKVEAGFAHYYGMSYNCLAEFYISTRGTGSETTDIIRRDTALAGSFTAWKTSSSVLRVAKNAGTYPGGGRYWIRVTKVTY